MNSGCTWDSTCLVCLVCSYFCSNYNTRGTESNGKNKRLISLSHVYLFKEFKEDKADKREQTSLCCSHKWCIIPLLCSLQLHSRFSCFSSPFVGANSYGSFVSWHKPGFALGSACMGFLMSAEALGRPADVAAVAGASEACSSMAWGAAG